MIDFDLSLPCRRFEMRKVRRFRVVTYNIHKCKGMDQRVRPERIVDVLREIDADIIALQEVLWIHGAESRDDQAHFIARELGLDICLGENRKLRGGAYGNVVLSRFPMIEACNHDISVRGREQRGCLRVKVDLHVIPGFCLSSISIISIMMSRWHWKKQYYTAAGLLSLPRITCRWWRISEFYRRERSVKGR